MQTRVSDAVAGSGVMVAAPRLGTEFVTVSDVSTGVPVEAPSKGVTVQVTSSAPTKPLDRVVPEPAELPLTDQATSDASASPSGSE